MLALTQGTKDLFAARSHRLATLLKVTRTDGTILRFTDHGNKITFEGADYTPVGSFNASARQVQGQLQKANAELVGLIDSTAITDADLLAGRYNNATIEEILVDWRYPFAGALVRTTFTVLEVQFNGRTWVAQIGGLEHRLSVKKGITLSRDCRHDLGDSGCKVSLGALTSTSTVSSVVTAKSKFRTGLTQANGFFNGGLLTWTSGANNGLKSEVKTYLNANGEIELNLETPFSIAVSDGFSVYRGCDKTVSTCKDVFNNVVNFGGFSFVPGDDRLLLTPDSKG